jgi:TPR repeat protein
LPLINYSRALVRPDDGICDPGNSYRVKPDFALLRGASATTKHDFKKAACWLNIGATQGDARSQGMLAFLLYQGKGVDRDYRQAFAWAEKGAAQKDIFGDMVLSELYREGKGVAPDAQKSAYWAKQAADQRSNRLWALLDTKSASGLTPRQVIGAGLAAFGAVMESIDEDGRRLDCTEHPNTYR